MPRTNAPRFVNVAALTLAIFWSCAEVPPKTLTATFGASPSPDSTDVQKSDPVRCMAVRDLCEQGDSECASFRQLLDEDKVVCPGVNAPLTATLTGPPVTSGPYAGAVNTPASSDTVKSRAGDGLAQLQAECDAAHGYKTFSVQVKCIESGIHLSREFAATAISDDIQLYTLTADNLVDEVGRKAITPAAARVELQKALLEFRDRVDRQYAEASAKENAARLQAQEAAAATVAERHREEERQAAAQAAEEAQKREAQNRYQEAVAFCVAEANARMNANPLYVKQHLTVGAIPALLGAPALNVNSLCANDIYWYKTIPKRITCQENGSGVDCTEQ